MTTPEEGSLCPVSAAVKAGVLCRPDGVLILATLLGGFQLAEGASLFGLSYEGAKKRRRHAESRLVSWMHESNGHWQAGQIVA